MSSTSRREGAAPRRKVGTGRSPLRRSARRARRHPARAPGARARRRGGSCRYPARRRRARAAGPVRARCHERSSRPSSSRRSASPSSPGANVGAGNPRAPGNAPSDCRGWKLRGHPGDRQLVHLLGPFQAAQSMLTEIQQPDTVGQPVAHEIGGHLREHDLAAMRRGHEPAGAVERKTEVVTVALVADAGVDAYADTKRAGGASHISEENARATSVAARTAFGAAANTAWTPSPVDLTTCPRAPRRSRAGSRHGAPTHPSSRRDVSPTCPSTPRDR